MLPDRVSNPGPLTYESGALPIALRGPARNNKKLSFSYHEVLLFSYLELWSVQKYHEVIPSASKRVGVGSCLQK